MLKSILKSILLLVSSFFTASVVYASCGGGFCSAVYVDKVYANISGPVYIGTSGNEANLNCTAVAGVYLTLEMDKPGSYTIYALLLEAQKANKVILITIDENSSGCMVRYATYDR